jgi:hypothetical protein
LAAKIMTEQPNPYEAIASEPDKRSAERSTLGKPLAALFGVFACAAASAVVGEVLSLVGLFPPVSGWIDFDNEFAGLILVGMPMLAGGAGALAGLVLGLLYPRFFCRLVSIIIGSLPAVLFCYGNYADESSRVSSMAISGIMIVSTVLGVVFTHRLLRRVEHRRGNQSSDAVPAKSSTSGRIATVIALGLAALSVVYDGWLWRVIESDKKSGHEFPLILAFGLAVLAVALNVYVWAAHPHRKAIAITSGLGAFVAFLAVLSVWYLRLIA